MAATVLTDDSEHARRLGGFGIAFILSLIVKHRLVDNEDMVATLGNNFIFLPFPDLTSISEPANLWKSRREGESPNVCHEQTTGRGRCLTLMSSLETSHSNLADSFSLTSTSWSGLVNSTCGAAGKQRACEVNRATDSHSD